MASLLVALAIDAIGSGLWISFSLLYFTRVVGLPLGEVGAALSAATFIGLAANPIGGALVDRTGAKVMLVIAFGLQALGYLGYLFVDTVPMLFAMAIPVIAGLRLFWVASPTLIADLSDGAQRDRWFAITGSIREGGIALGGAIAGVTVALLGSSAYRGLLVANLVSFLVGAVLVTRIPYQRTPHPPGVRPSYREVLRDVPYLGVTLANTIFAFCAILESVALPVFVVERLDEPEWLVGVLFTTYTLMLAIGMPLVIRRVVNYRRTRTMAAAAVTYIIAFACYIAALWMPHALVIPWLVSVTVVFAIADALHGPTASSLSASAGPEHLRGRYLSMYSLSWGLGHALAPGIAAAAFTVAAGGPWWVGIVLASGAIGILLIVEPKLPREAIYPTPSVAAETAEPA